MVKFDYLPDDGIARVTDVFSSFNEPSNPIPAEIIELTGITDEMVYGHQIDPDAVLAFASDAVIIVAHNANFDRKFVERCWPLFERKRWACPATEVEWRYPITPMRVSVVRPNNLASGLPRRVRFENGSDLKARHAAPVSCFL